MAPAATGTLARLLDELPALAMADDGVVRDASGYVELLAEVLEDGVLTGAEASSLIEFAKSYSLTGPQAQQAHRSFVLALAQRAMEDGKVTRDERREIVAVAEVLGLGAEVPKEILLEARAAVAERLGATCQQLPETWELGAPLRVGDGVAFTSCDDLERAQLEGRAQAAGLRVTGAVSRKTVILVTDGADNTTSKARKAHELGTRIVTPEVFAVMVQFVQPADT